MGMTFVMPFFMNALPYFSVITMGIASSGIPSSQRRSIQCGNVVILFCGGGSIRGC